MEHPVTEWIAEVNLPAAQVAVGMGIPLWQIPGMIFTRLSPFLLSLVFFSLVNYNSSVN